MLSTYVMQVLFMQVLFYQSQLSYDFAELHGSGDLYRPQLVNLSYFSAVS